jgi:hypothetical protein
LAEHILRQAKSFEVSEKGIRQLDEFWTDLDRPAIKSILNEEEEIYLHGQIKNLLARRKKIWQAGILAKHPPMSVLPHIVDDISNLSAFVFRHHDLCSKSVLLIDAYNAIKSSVEWAILDSQDFAGARNRFIELCELRAKDWKRIELIFDGQEDHHWIEDRDRLTIVYTDGRLKSQKADQYIQTRMEELKLQYPDTKLFLISADRQLRDSVCQWCDYFIEPRWALIPYFSVEENKFF